MGKASKGSRKLNIDRRGDGRPIALDLFSGCGGLTQGLKNADFNVVGAIDCDALAMKTYQKNHKGVKPWEKEIQELSPEKVREKLGLKCGELDLLAGCPPCQGFSRMRTLNGSKALDDLDTVALNDLVFSFMDYVEEFLPKTVMMENVPGLLKDKRMKKVLSRFRKAGYCVPGRGEKLDKVAQILNAAHFGVPQRRRRLILMVARKGFILFADPVPEKKRMTVGEAFAEMTLGPAGESGDKLHDFPERRSKEVMDRIRAIPPNGGSRKDLGAEKQLGCHKRSDGFKDVYGRMDSSTFAPTITSGCTNPSKGRFLHPTEHRAITLREAAILQSFPEGYHFSLDRGKIGAALMIGNAFPPAFIEPHANNIREYLSDHY